MKFIKFGLFINLGKREEIKPFGKFLRRSIRNLRESVSDPKKDLTCTTNAVTPIKEIKFKNKSFFLSCIIFNRKKGKINKLPLPVKKASKEYIKFKIFCFFAFNININPVDPQYWTLIKLSHISGELRKLDLKLKKYRYIYF